MHATVHPYRRPTGAETEPRDVVRTADAGGPDPAGAVVVDHRDGNGGTVVALWSEELPTPRGTRAYTLVDRMHGAAAGRTPLFAQLAWLNGAGDPDVARAAERAGRERIHPAIRDVDGLVGALVLRSADDRIVVVSLATGLEALTGMRDRIAALPLLPGEDPALLPGADRIEFGRVLRADVPAEVRS